MARRFKGRMNGERYVGNRCTWKVHDQDTETSRCQINDIIDAGQEEPFEDYVEAQSKGYEHCSECFTELRR